MSTTSRLSRAALCLACALAAVGCGRGAAEDASTDGAARDAAVAEPDASCGAATDRGTCAAAGVSWGSSCTGCWHCWVTDTCGRPAIWSCRDGLVSGELEPACDAGVPDAASDAGCAAPVGPPDSWATCPGGATAGACECGFACTFRGACGEYVGAAWCEGGSIRTERGGEPCDGGA